MRGLNAQAWVIDLFPVQLPTLGFSGKSPSETTAARKVERFNMKWPSAMTTTRITLAGPAGFDLVSLADPTEPDLI